MIVKTYREAILLCIVFAFSSYFSYDYYTKKKKDKVRKEIHEVIMFSHDVTKLKKSKYSRIMITESMERLLYHLSSPRHSLDICMYVFTNSDLAYTVLKLHYRGVKVRMIIDADMAFASGSNVRKLEKQGIPVRWMKSTNLMHHKFCLFDASADISRMTPVVMMGSLNWTNQALNGNWEDVTLTSQEDLVRQFKAEFERLWDLFKPIVGFV